VSVGRWTIVLLLAASGCAEPRPPASPPATTSHVVMGPPPSGQECAYPPEADEREIDSADVLLQIVVSATGELRSVRVVEDPGYGFGDVAARCIRARRFKPARDAAGHPVEATEPVRVRFRRSSVLEGGMLSP
jgi:TonB family protein